MTNIINKSDYEGCSIVNIRRHRNSTNHVSILAHLVDKEGRLLISADIGYIVKALEDRIPQVNSVVGDNTKQ